MKERCILSIRYAMVCFTEHPSFVRRIWFVRRQDRMMYRFACFQFRCTFIPRMSDVPGIAYVPAASRRCIIFAIHSRAERKKSLSIARLLYLLKTCQRTKRARDILCEICLRLSLCEKSTRYQLFDLTIKF